RWAARGSTRPASGGEGRKHPAGAGADDVGHAPAVSLRGRPGGAGVVAPPAGVGPEGGKLERGGRKMPASDGEGHIDAVSAEADDVGHAVAVNVCKRARVGVVAAPTAGVGPEGGKLERGGGKVSAWGGERLADASSAEAGDGGHAVAGYVRQRARIEIVVAPT